MQACKSIAPSISIDSSVQVFRQHVKGDGYPLNTTRLRNVTQSPTISPGYRDISDPGSSIRDFDTHAEVDVYICILTASVYAW